MKVHVLKTDLMSDRHVQSIENVLNMHPNILRWHVDTEDIDKVLRVEFRDQLHENDLIQLLDQHAVKCESLPD